jgi:hypothetical protein
VGACNSTKKKPEFKMKPKIFEKLKERPQMTNNCFIVGLNKIPNYEKLFEDVTQKLKKAREKVTERWID